MASPWEAFSIIILCSVLLLSQSDNLWTDVKDNVKVDLLQGADIPSPPKTRLQIANEAWTLANQIKSVAGRKTSPSSDGSGGIQIPRTSEDATKSDFDEGIHRYTETKTSGGQTYVTKNETWLDSFDQTRRQWIGIDPTLKGKLGGEQWIQVETVPYFYCYDSPYNAEPNGQPAGQGFPHPGNSWGVFGTEIPDAYYDCWIRWNHTLVNEYNVSASMLTTNTGFTYRIWSFIISGAADTTNVSMNGQWKLRVSLQANGNGKYDIYGTYIDGSGIIHYYSSGSWSTTLGKVSTGIVPWTTWLKVSIAKTTTNYVYTIKRQDTGALITSFSIAQASVRNGTSNPDYVEFGHPQIAWPGDVANFITGLVDNVTIIPPVTTATFVSRPFGFGEWTALLTKVAWVQSGSPPFQIRRSNNSDMTNAGNWIMVTNNTDLTAFSYVAGFFQYRANFTDSAKKLYRVTWSYSSVNYGDGPSKDVSGVISKNSTWNFQNYTLTKPTRIFLNHTGTINLWMNHTVIDGVNYSSGLTRMFQPTVGDASIAPRTGSINIYVSNSTLRNFGNFTYHAFAFTSFIVTISVRWYWDNVTAMTFNNAGLWSTYDLTFENWQSWFRYGSVHDSDVTNSDIANIGGFGSCWSCTLFSHNKVIRPFFPASPQATGNAALFDFHPFSRCTWNWMIGGYNGCTLTGNFSGVGLPRTVIGYNVSYNYFDNMSHTPVGVYGTSPDAYWAKNIGNPYYALVFKNVITNGTYIQAQTGSVGNITFKNNYFYLPNPTGTFTEAIGLNWNTQNVTLDSNFIWNTGTGTAITVVDYARNIEIAHNVLYDIGNYSCGYGLYIGSLGKLHRDLTVDFAARDSNVVTHDNFFDGSYGKSYILADSAYWVSRNDSFGPNHPVGAFLAPCTPAGTWAYIRALKAFAYLDIQFIDSWYMTANGTFSKVSAYQPHSQVVGSFSEGATGVRFMDTTPIHTTISVLATVESGNISQNVSLSADVNLPILTYAWGHYSGGVKETLYGGYNVTLHQSLLPLLLDTVTITDETNGASVPWHQGSIVFNVTISHSYSVTFGSSLTSFLVTVLLPLMIGIFGIVFILLIILFIKGRVEDSKDDHR